MAKKCLLGLLVVVCVFVTSCGSLFAIKSELYTTSTKNISDIRGNITVTDFLIYGPYRKAEGASLLLERIGIEQKDSKIYSIIYDLNYIYKDAYGIITDWSRSFESVDIRELLLKINDGNVISVKSESEPQINRYQAGYVIRAERRAVYRLSDSIVKQLLNCNSLTIQLGAGPANIPSEGIEKMKLFINN